MGLFDDLEEVVEEVAEVALIEEVAGGAGYNRRHGYGRGGYNNGPHLGVDVRDGDLVEDFGNGLGMDLETGQIEFEAGNSGLNF